MDYLSKPPRFAPDEATTQRLLVNRMINGCGGHLDPRTRGHRRPDPGETPRRAGHRASLFGRSLLRGRCPELRPKANSRVSQPSGETVVFAGGRRNGCSPRVTVTMRQLPPACRTSLCNERVCDSNPRVGSQAAGWDSERAIGGLPAAGARGSGQEIEVLIVSRDEAATAYGNLDGGSGGIGRSGDGGQAGTAEEEAGDGTSEANSLGCASQQDSRKGARRGREEASKVAGPDREEGASEAQATEEGLARQVDKLSTGRFPGAAYRRPCLWQRRLSPSGAGRCVFASGILPCSVSFATTCRGKAGH
jgi:hypothetical protein